MAASGSRRWALVLGTCIALLVLLVPQVARAQTCPNLTISVNQVVPRYVGATDSNADLFPYRAQNLQPSWINYNDCSSNIRLQFTITVSGLPCSDTIQVWAGTTDCTQVSARQANSGATHCWPVTPTGAFAMQASSTGDIRAQDIVAFVTNPEPPTIYSPSGVGACQSQASPGGVSLSMYFMAIEADGQTVDGTAAEYDFGADLVGPYPPSNITAGVGENLIVVNWTPAVDSTIQGFNIYCQDQGAIVTDAGAGVPEATLVCPETSVSTVPEADLDGEVDGEADSSTPTDAGCHYVNLIDAGGANGSSCVSNALKNEFVIGQTPTFDAGDASLVVPQIDGAAEASTTGTAVGISDIPGMYLCGQVGGNTTSSYTVQQFTDSGPMIRDGVQYAVTVAATDGTGNTGIIGNLSCVIPSPVIDFWTAYTSDACKGDSALCPGGGFCALEGAGMPVGGSLFGLGMGAAALAMARRRRRRRR